METIYTSVMTCGRYEDRDSEIVYCGIDYEKAKKACEDYQFPEKYNQTGVILYWVNGVKVKFDEIIK